MATRIYIGNLPFTATVRDVAELFGRIGKVNTVDIERNALDGCSQGFGFIEMAEVHEAEKAVAQLDGAEFNGRTLRVNAARPDSGRSGDRDNASDDIGTIASEYPAGHGTIYGKDLRRGNF